MTVISNMTFEIIEISDEVKNGRIRKTYSSGRRIENKYAEATKTEQKCYNPHTHTCVHKSGFVTF